MHVQQLQDSYYTIGKDGVLGLVGGDSKSQDDLQYSIELIVQSRVQNEFQDYCMVWLQYGMSSRTGWVGWSFQDSYYTIEESRVSSRTHGTHTLDYYSFQDWVRLVLFMVVQSFYGFLYSMVQSTILYTEWQNSRSSTTVKCCTNFFKLAIHGHLNQFLTR